MTKLAQRGRNVAASPLAPYLALLALAAALLVTALFPAAGRAEEAPLLSFSPAPVEFAKTTAGTESAAREVDVYNAGPSSLAIEQLLIEGADQSDFKVSGGDCGWLGADQHCTVWVAFMPGTTATRGRRSTCSRRKRRRRPCRCSAPPWRRSSPSPLAPTTSASSAPMKALRPHSS